ncbi:sugar dehydrogenase complex small subunit [Azotobacter beijerinckii]|uniref:sugar dehydrogenase complex small subunit n=1 Tax=Azotobacter beijerinckii TaxID=170623 RepID=UPI002952F335|nr:sugar dehydrogenase complex small subunit [Azotobacter beijerinckii]MDV7211017.1 sugar dehydrogenase complex small subunit [Azotobacter beijerinckii]
MSNHASVTPGPAPVPAFTLSRRRLLGAACVGAAAGVLLLNPVGSAWAAAPKAETELATFMTLSQRLTGRNDLDGKLGQSLYEALTKRDAAFAKDLGELQGKLGKTPQGLSGRPQEVARQILAAWYLGLVGSDHTATVVTYQDALMFKAVDGALKPRAFCFGSPGSWAEKPVVGRA